MNKLKMLKINISSTWFLSLALFVVVACTMVLFSISYYPSIARIKGDIDIYDNNLKDYCLISFDASKLSVKKNYKELSTVFDMENFAGIASYGGLTDYSNPYHEKYFSFEFVSEKMVTNLPSLGYDFKKTKPKGYKQAFAPYELREKYEIGKKYPISCYEGDEYGYEQTVEIIGYTDKPYYSISNAITNSMITEYGMYNSFLIYDDIPKYAKVNGGMMMSDKSAEYYRELGANCRTFKELNDLQRTSEVNDSFLYWCISTIILFAIVIAANYYFTQDRLIKRSGIMFIYGGKRSDIVLVEFIKMLLLFIFAFAISAFVIAMIILKKGEYDFDTIVDWKTFFKCSAIMFAIYFSSISFGLIKLVKFNPLKALSNSNVD